MHKIKKGMFGYLNYKKKTEAIKTLILFAIPLCLFIAGLITTGTRRNLLTIVAVLGFLPASKYAVLLIMYLKSRGIGVADHEIVESTLEKCFEKDGEGIRENLIMLYDLVFTTQEHTYEVPAMFLYAGSACGYLQVKKKAGGKEPSSKKKDISELAALLQKHLENSLKKEGISETVKIYEDFESFTRRITELKSLDKADRAKERPVRRILFEISL